MGAAGLRVDADFRVTPVKTLLLCLGNVIGISHVLLSCWPLRYRGHVFKLTGGVAGKGLYFRQVEGSEARI